VSLSGARAAYVGPALDLAPHRNAVATVAVALRTPFAIDLPTPLLSDAAAMVALIPPDTLHHLRAEGEMAFVYLDAVGDDHAALKTLDLALGAVRVRAAHATGSAPTVDALCALLGVPARQGKDARIAEVLRRMNDEPDAFADVAAAAAAADLSSSRFQALFRSAAGVPSAATRVWRRMAAVMRSVAGGASLTPLHTMRASPLRHLSAAFREMFGLSPSDLLRLGAVIDFPAAPRKPIRPPAALPSVAGFVAR
jgi:AraC-like DNA-binding protein